MTLGHLLRLLVASMVVLTLLTTVHPVPLADAASLTFTVTSTADTHDAEPGNGVCADETGHCTVRAAVEEANAEPSGSTISITVPAGRYALALGVLTVSATTVMLSGAGVRSTVITGQGVSQVLRVQAGATVTVDKVTITGGLQSGTGTSGGGIDNAGGRLTLTQSAVISNTASEVGGGIANSGTLIVASSTLSGNSASFEGNGGGIYNSFLGTLTVISSTLSDNTAIDGQGGAIANDGTATVINSTLSGNSSPVEGDGGGIFSDGTVTVVESTLSGNTAYYAGGLANFGMATLDSSTLSGNTATVEGGGIDNSGTLLLVSSTLSGNVVSGVGEDVGGGGIDNFGMLTVATSTLSGNTADQGGGIFNQGGGIVNGVGTVTVVSSTLSDNTATTYGGGITDAALCSEACLGLRVVNSTFAGNTAPAGGGLAVTGGDLVSLTAVTLGANASGVANTGSSTVLLTGTLLSGSTTGPNCSGSLTERGGHNLSSDTSCGFSRPTDITNTNPLLGPLATNGGPTQTMALLPGSPAIDHGPTHAQGCPATDQRGAPRPDPNDGQERCDIGAFESQQSQLPSS